MATVPGSLLVTVTNYLSAKSSTSHVDWTSTHGLLCSTAHNEAFALWVCAKFDAVILSSSKSMQVIKFGPLVKVPYALLRKFCYILPIL